MGVYLKAPQTYYLLQSCKTFYENTTDKIYIFWSLQRAAAAPHLMQYISAEDAKSSLKCIQIETLKSKLQCSLTEVVHVVAASLMIYNNPAKFTIKF